MLEMCWCFWICETLRDLVVLLLVVLPLLGFYCRGGFCGGEGG
jgi:hypothetical protein